MRTTPAITAGVTNRFWTFGDLMAELEAVPFRKKFSHLTGEGG